MNYINLLLRASILAQKVTFLIDGLMTQVFWNNMSKLKDKLTIGARKVDGTI